jgi:hypothetical protein
MEGLELLQERQHTFAFRLDALNLNFRHGLASILRNSESCKSITLPPVYCNSFLTNCFNRLHCNANGFGPGRAVKRKEQGQCLYNRSMRGWLMIAIAAASVGPATAAEFPPAAEIVRQCIELDQSNWMRMKDYTWTSRETTRHLDSTGKVKSTESEGWETVVLFGKPFRKLIERNGQPLSPDKQRKEQEKLDKDAGKLEEETPEERQQRLATFIKEREKNREFLREIPDAFEFRVEGEERIDGRDTWVIAVWPKPGYQAKHGDAKAFAKIEGRIWIDQSEYQWVRIEAKTLETISAGLVLARLNPGATLIFEQTRINDEVWLPKRQFVSGSGRLALLKKLSEQQETIWSDYRKFQVDSKVVSTR